jgi:PAS domain S-box-containing protein
LTSGVAAEQVAREAIDRYHLVAEQSRTVFWEIDAEGKYTHVSHVCLAVWGYDPSELVGSKYFYDLHPEAGRDEFQRMAFEVFAAKGAFRELRNPVVRKDGITLWVSSTAVPLVGQDGLLLGYRGSDTDITDRHRAEVALAAERRKLANVIDGTHAGIWEWNIQSGEASFDARWAEIIGYGPQELDLTSIQTWIGHAHPDDLLISQQQLAEHFAGKSAIYDCECRMRHKNGSWVWVHDRGKVTAWDRSGAPLQMAGTHTDITERKRSEQALKDSQIRLQLAMEASELAQERFRLHMQGTPMAYVEMDTEGRITYWNPASEGIFGFSREQVLGRRASEVLSLAGSDRDAPGFLELLRQSGASRLTLEHLTGGGHPITCEWSSTRLVTSSGHAIGTACLGQNITELRLALDRLRKSKEIAEQATRAKSEFLSTMSHEIRTPMNGILGMGGLLLESGLSPEQLSFAEAIRSSAEALLGIINDILDFSKVEAGKLEIERVPFNLQTAIEDVVELVALKAQEKHLELTIWYPHDTPRIFDGDVGRIRQVLLNLVNNAVKFTDHGHVLIEVSARGTVEGHVHDVRIAVQDTGVGISPDKFNLLFTHFTQLDSSSKRRYGGSGLGLAISRRLANLMGGEIHVVSEPGEGSTFTLQIPLPCTFEAASDIIPATPHLHGLRALVVEGHQISRFVHVEWCTGWGMRVDEAPSAAVALSLFEKAMTAEGDPYSIVIVDHLVPDGTGVSLTEQLRALSVARVPVVLMTGYDFRYADQLRMGDFAVTLPKPTRPLQLRDAVLRAMRGSVPGAPQSPQFPASLAAHPTPTSGCTRALLVEDNAINQRVAAALLKKFGCQVEIAGNGREALDLLERVPFDIVFMDCQMPEMDGFEASSEIRQLPPPVRDIPIIALTAGAMEADRQKCLAAGMNDYLAKPVNPEMLRTMLASWQARSGRSSPRPSVSC